MKEEEKWKHIKELVVKAAEAMDKELIESPELKDKLTSPTFIRFNLKNWCQLTPGKSIIIGISSNKFMKVCRWKTR